MKVLADISAGNSDWADVFFLIAVILFFLSALVHYRPGPDWPFSWSMLAAGLGFVALGLLVL
jgi:hypothetical protein